MFVNMIELVGCFDCQQHEFAQIFGSDVTVSTKLWPCPITGIGNGSALVFFGYKFIQFVKIMEGLKECPFNAVQCAKNHWGILSCHQFLSLSKL
jgi:hypothetical protein